MYGLDINFLKDREIRPVEAAGPSRPAAAPGDKTPLFLGLLVGVFALGLVGGYWFWLQRQITALEAEEERLNAELAEVQAQRAQLDTIRQQTELVRAEIQAYGRVFDQIRPWSALLRDLRDRTPLSVQITSIQQTAGTVLPGEGDGEAADAGEDLPLAPGGVDVVGVACSFNDINDLLLTMQRSPLLQGESVTISSAVAQSDYQLATCPSAGNPVLPIDFTIQANFSDVPSSELLEVLNTQGAVGLATRVRAIRDTGLNTEEAEAVEVEDTGAEETP
ncbi:MAG: PilN domain-containing protein [Cyanobacteria bacterium P01_H01_bin.58]